jgi:hypothetical protein
LTIFNSSDINTPIKQIKELYLNNLQMIGLIKHELMHVVHSIKNSNLSYRNGEAYQYANDIALNVGDKNILNYYDICILNGRYKDKGYLDNNDLVRLISCGIYYMDNSEFQAWKESFNMYDLYFRYDKDLNKRMPYKLYKILNYLWKENKNALIHCYNKNILRENTYQIISKYFNYIGYNKVTNLKNLINKWIKRSNDFITKCEDIYTINQ